jgi:mRNA interferase MazF
MCVILSQDVLNERSGTVIAVTITGRSHRTGFPVTFELDSTDLPKCTWVNINRIRMLSTERIVKKIDTVSQEELDQILEGMNEITGS